MTCIKFGSKLYVGSVFSHPFFSKNSSAYGYAQPSTLFTFFSPFNHSWCIYFTYWVVDLNKHAISAIALGNTATPAVQCVKSGWTSWPSLCRSPTAPSHALSAISQDSRSMNTTSPWSYPTDTSTENRYCNCLIQCPMILGSYITVLLLIELRSAMKSLDSSSIINNEITF